MRHELNRFKALLKEHAQRQPDAIAVQGADQHLTYRALFEAVEVRAAWLGSQPQGAFALALDNGPQLLLWDLAALFAERPCVVIPPFFTRAQMSHCLRQSGVTLVLSESGWDSRLVELGYAPHARPGFWLCKSFAAAAIAPETAKITYTSGSTGSPKGVCLSAEALLGVAHELEAASRASAPMHHLAVLPLGVLLENLGVYAALIAGACVHLLSQQHLGISGATQVDFKRLVGVIVQRQAQSLILVPQLLMGLVAAVEQGAMPAEQLRFVAVGGARVSPSLLARAEAVGLAVYEGYGLSECASVVALNRPGSVRRGSVGKSLPHVQVRIAKDGEVLVAGCTLLGYLDAAPFDGRWWATGDLGHLDDDGYLYLDGRKKHQFITSFGRNVSPEWVEAELTQSGVIAQAFVHGESLPGNVALIWPMDPSLSDDQIDQVVGQCNARLPDYARAHHWRRLTAPLSVTDQTLTANGRPRREAILERYQSLIRIPQE